MQYISCDYCEDWFHGNCIGINEKGAEGVEKYKCPNCRKGKGDNEQRRMEKEMEKLDRELNDTKNPIRQLNEQDQTQKDEIARLKSEAKLTKTKQIEEAKTDRKELEEQKRIVREKEKEVDV